MDILVANTTKGLKSGTSGEFRGRMPVEVNIYLLQVLARGLSDGRLRKPGKKEHFSNKESFLNNWHMMALKGVFLDNISSSIWLEN